MKNKYVTTKKFSGRSYSEVAKIMTSDGSKMNHSSVRNYVSNGFIKVAKNISKCYGFSYTDEKLKEIAQSQEFQESIIDIMKRK